jgi:hypothetical protein
MIFNPIVIKLNSVEKVVGYANILMFNKDSEWFLRIYFSFWIITRALHLKKKKAPLNSIHFITAYLLLIKNNVEAIFDISKIAYTVLNAELVVCPPSCLLV